MLVIHRGSGQLDHRLFRDIGEYLQAGDVIVANDSRVVPARLRARKAETGGSVEVLLLQPETPEVWRALIRPSKRVRQGMRLEFESDGGATGMSLVAEVLRSDVEPSNAGAQRATDSERGQEVGRADGVRRVRFSAGGGDLAEVIEAFGSTPLPPYIHEQLDDPERYQTVYARPKGSVAAPTAGLHFTPELMERLQAQGVRIEYVTCHIGLHTFRPIQAGEVEEHDIHEEWCLVPQAVADAANEARAEGRRIVAVGTSSVRALETAWQDGAVRPFDGWTRLYIYPGYKYRAVDALITNFHLPRTTLMALVSAFASRELILRAYEEAVARRYRFYSFGDACLIL